MAIRITNSFLWRAWGLSMLAACSSSSQPATTAETDRALLPCDVDALLQTRCRECHSDPPQFGAPMSLTKHGDVLKHAQKDPSKTVAEEMLVRMQDRVNPMPQPPRPAATEAEVELIRTWIASGFPARPAGQSCGAAGGSGGAGGANSSYELPCTPDIIIKPQSQWQMPQATEDQYVCYGFDAPGSQQKRHITALGPRLDNTSIVHHLLVFEASEALSTTPTPCDPVPQPSWKLLYAWGPGTPPYKLPPEAGFPIEAGGTTHFIMQVHYSNLTHKAGEADATGMNLCSTSTLRPHDADVMAFGGTNFSIPPHTTTALRCAIQLPPSVNSFLPLHVFQAWPHMHQIGYQLSTTVLHTDGSQSALGSVNLWNFNSQITYPVSVDLKAGDTVQTTCAWKNPKDKAVNFGQKTSDEMCFNFITYYPRITASGWSALLPSFIAHCDPVP